MHVNKVFVNFFSSLVFLIFEYLCTFVMYKINLIMENPFSTGRPVRPTFLTVLCILTFIGSGWGLISNLFQLAMFTPERLVAQIQEITNMVGAEVQPSWGSSIMNSSLEVLQTTIKYGKAIYSLVALCAMISLIGAFMMYKLKRNGFYLYVIAQIGQLFILPIYSGWNSVVLIYMAMSVFWALVFIILYALNYSKLRY